MGSGSYLDALWIIILYYPFSIFLHRQQEGCELHTFLFQEADWEAEGILLDQDGNESAATGVTRIRHGEDEWRIEGEMTTGLDDPSVIRNDYTLVPWPGGEDASPWEAVSPVLGLLFGMIAVVGDTILSRFVSEDGEYSGMESFRMIDETTYENRGALFKRDRKISSWRMELKNRVNR
jgi:hypothetical protein